MRAWTDSGGVPNWPEFEFELAFRREFSKLFQIPDLAQPIRFFQKSILKMVPLKFVGTTAMR